MSPSDTPEDTGRDVAKFSFAGQPRDDSGPVFADPWQAQAFALVVRLHEEGRFTWKEWAETLGAQIAKAEQEGRPDDGSHYYDHWLDALETLMATKGLVAPDALQTRKDAWEQAYLTTPHGKPVGLKTEG